MDTTPQPIAPDLQASLRHLRRIVLGGAAALVLLAGAAGYAAPAHAAAGDPSQWGLTTGKDPELPVTSTLASKDPELPVTPTLTPSDGAILRAAGEQIIEPPPGPR
jgi:hypothetical protein